MYSSFEVFLREKLLAVAIHSVSMKLEAHLPWSFMTLLHDFLESQGCVIFISHCPLGSAFHPVVSHMVVD